LNELFPIPASPPRSTGLQGNDSSSDAFSGADDHVDVNTNYEDEALDEEGGDCDGGASSVKSSTVMEDQFADSDGLFVDVIGWFIGWLVNWLVG
jgi:hypothetical protein